ncbi:hypothetical protein AAMO2058_001029400 [Amorphochlora amoebiformis]
MAFSVRSRRSARRPWRLHRGVCRGFLAAWTLVGAISFLLMDGFRQNREGIGVGFDEGGAIYHPQPVDIKGITCARPDAPRPKRPASPAFRQVDQPLEDIRSRLMDKLPGQYNIWHDKMSHNREYVRDMPKLRDPSRTKCIPDRDVGFTVADKLELTGPPEGYICHFFAKGMCFKGPECIHFHRIPTEYDEFHCPHSHTIFGFQRDAKRKNIRGRGSVLREDGQKTLMAEFKAAKHLFQLEELKRLLHEGFSEWGPVRKIMVMPTEGIAYIEYFWRVSAEFAKDAMRFQYLNPADPQHDSIMDVTWKPEDMKDEIVDERNEKKKMIFEAARDKDATEEEKLMAHIEATGQYPETSDRFGNPKDKQKGATLQETGDGSVSLFDPQRDPSTDGDQRIPEEEIPDIDEDMGRAILQDFREVLGPLQQKAEELLSKGQDLSTLDTQGFERKQVNYGISEIFDGHRIDHTFKSKHEEGLKYPNIPQDGLAEPSEVVTIKPEKEDEALGKPVKGNIDIQEEVKKKKKKKRPTGGRAGSMGLERMSSNSQKRHLNTPPGGPPKRGWKPS